MAMVDSVAASLEVRLVEWTAAALTAAAWMAKVDSAGAS